MAPDQAESHSAPDAHGEVMEPAPSSSPLRVNANTQLESGIPPARQRHDSDSAALFGAELTLEDGVQRMEAALANVVRTEANLGLLMRGLKHLAAGAEAARTANSELMNELDELRAHLTRSREEEHALRFRMSQLEQLLSLIRHETTSEREFLIEEQDRFLLEILNDHERQLSELRQRVRESRQHQPDSDKVLELIAQRDQARDYATRCERERDLAWQELAAGVATPKKLSAEHIQRSPSAAATIGAIGLHSVAVPASTVALDGERSSDRHATRYSVSGEDISE
ncbi:MAG TPA: hypothetical protein VJV79_12850 [Polyangiaceae bacterium]|nr:hypothetical protein [Polyangiaceae bacterium]